VKIDLSVYVVLQLAREQRLRELTHSPNSSPKHSTPGALQSQWRSSPGQHSPAGKLTATWSHPSPTKGQQQQQQWRPGSPLSTLVAEEGGASRDEGEPFKVLQQQLLSDVDAVRKRQKPEFIRWVGVHVWEGLSVFWGVLTAALSYLQLVYTWHAASPVPLRRPFMHCLHVSGERLLQQPNQERTMPSIVRSEHRSPSGGQVWSCCACFWPACVAAGLNCARAWSHIAPYAHHLDRPCCWNTP
jgi:hypothetical protein